MDKKFLKILSIITVIIGVLPLFLSSPYYMQVLINIGTWTIISLGLTVLLGFTGQISFAQVTFFGIGAYTAGITTATYGCAAHCRTSYGGNRIRLSCFFNRSAGS